MWLRFGSHGRKGDGVRNYGRTGRRTDGGFKCGWGRRGILQFTIYPLPPVRKDTVREYLPGKQAGRSRDVLLGKGFVGTRPRPRNFGVEMNLLVHGEICSWVEETVVDGRWINGCGFHPPHRDKTTAWPYARVVHGERGPADNRANNRQPYSTRGPDKNRHPCSLSLAQTNRVTDPARAWPG